MAKLAGMSRLDGACNEPTDVGRILPGFCHRPDNGSGLCNVHQAARERGARKRAENDRIRRALFAGKRGKAT